MWAVQALILALSSPPPIVAVDGVQSEMAELVLTPTDDGTTKHATVGESVTIRLKEIPSTGYRWSLEFSKPHAVETLEDRWIPPAGSAVGGEGERVFRLRLTAKGEVVLRLKLWRKWQGEGSIIEHHAFTLSVR